jgi:MFS transporter, UMF1 family
VGADAVGEVANTLETTHGRIVAWSLRDWGSAAFNAIVTTFVFTVYITGSSFGD